MQRYIKFAKDGCDKDRESLRSKIINCLENCGKDSLRLKKNETFSYEEFINTWNTFAKLALRCNFACSKTIRVLTNLTSNIYSAHSSDLLLQPTNLHQLILNHSKFLEIILGEPTASGNPDTKEALIDLLQTVVDIDGQCCHSTHLSFILSAYTATLSTSDQKLLRLLYTYEAQLDEPILRSRILWGRAAVNSYQTTKNDSSASLNKINITQILDLIDAKVLLQSAKNFPHEKTLEPINVVDFREKSHLYDPSFLLPVFSFFMSEGDEVHCHRFVECSALAYAINALTSHDKDMRQLAYQILSRFQQHLTTARFRAKPQIAHLLYYFQNGITEPNCRISSLMTSFMTRALHIFLYPEDPLYTSVNSYILQKAFMDIKDVPLFLSHLNGSDLSFLTERLWLLHLILDGLRDPMDYYTCRKFHVFQQLLTLYHCASTDQSVKRLILKIVQQVCSHHVAAYDLCFKYGLVSWCRLLFNATINSNTFRQSIDILSTIWSSLIGGKGPHDEESMNGDDCSNRSNIPKNVSAEMLLVFNSVLNSTMSVQVWNEDTLKSFLRMFSSLLYYQRQSCFSSMTMSSVKHHYVQLSQIWRKLFCNIDVFSHLKAFIEQDQSLSSETLASEKWFQSLRNVLEVLLFTEKTIYSEEVEERLRMYQSFLRIKTLHIRSFLTERLHNALQSFWKITDVDLLTLERQLDLIFLYRIVSNKIELLK